MSLPNDDPNDFSSVVRSVSTTLPKSVLSTSEDIDLEIQMVSFSNKLVISITYNGEKDSCYKIPIPNSQILGSISGLSIDDEEAVRNPRSEENEDEEYDEEYDEAHGLSEDILDRTLHIDPICLMGNSSNQKLRILCSQLLVMLLSLNKNETRDILVMCSSKIFPGKLDEASDKDFDVLFYIMQSIKDCYMKFRR